MSLDKYTNLMINKDRLENPIENSSKKPRNFHCFSINDCTSKNKNFLYLKIKNQNHPKKIIFEDNIYEKYLHNYHNLGLEKIHSHDYLESRGKYLKSKNMKEEVNSEISTDSEKSTHERIFGNRAYNRVYKMCSMENIPLPFTISIY